MTGSAEASGQAAMGAATIPPPLSLCTGATLGELRWRRKESGVV